MYSEALEAIIDAALADGVLTDKEREVLHKRAEQEGIDPDELDVVIEGKLAKMKREEDWLRPSPPQPTPLSSKVGNVMKCPNCGAQYEPGTAQCAECGHVFQNREAVRSAQKLFEGIQAIKDKWAPMIVKEAEDNNTKKEKSYSVTRQMEDEVKTFITNFPIPTTKDDLLEFITSMAGRKNGNFDDFADGYHAKLKEAINKAMVYFPNDPQFSPLIEKYTKASWENLSPQIKNLLIPVGALIFVFIFFILMIAMLA